MELKTQARNMDITHQYMSVQNNDHVYDVNNITKEILDNICAFIEPGMKESEVVQYTALIYKKYNVDRIWHQPLVRFGSNTLLSYMEKAKTDLVLKQEDIVFVDIGIVISGIEGDAGKTLSYGDNPIYKDIEVTTSKLFNEATTFWKINNPTGQELYQYLHKQANQYGYEFNLDNAGHLIGGFSHAQAKYSTGLNNYPFTIDPYRWILEIQIRHPELGVGGFYEDLLY